MSRSHIRCRFRTISFDRCVLKLKNMAFKYGSCIFYTLSCTPNPTTTTEGVKHSKPKRSKRQSQAHPSVSKPSQEEPSQASEKINPRNNTSIEKVKHTHPSPDPSRHCGCRSEICTARSSSVSAGRPAPSAARPAGLPPRPARTGSRTADPSSWCGPSSPCSGRS